MVAPKVRLNNRDFGEALVAFVGPVQEKIADDIASRARSAAPVASGEYRDGIDTNSDVWHKGALSFLRARVIARAAHSTVVEAKTGNLKRAIGG